MNKFKNYINKIKSYKINVNNLKKNNTKFMNNQKMNLLRNNSSLKYKLKIYKEK